MGDREPKTEPNDQESFQDTEGINIYKSFDDMPLNSNLLRGIYSRGFEKPSAIQQRAIVPFTKGGDIIAQAQSGTGKTGAFSIGLLQRIDFRHKNDLQALVLSPTRELALQTYDVIKGLGEFMSTAGADPSSFCQSLVGGSNIMGDIKKLNAGVIVAVGTPGRVQDLSRRGNLRLDKLMIIVLDEADEMLSQGFMDQVKDIFRKVPKDVQVALFSATMDTDVLELTTQFMRNPTRILVKQESLTLEGIKQYYIDVEEEDKLDLLVDLYEQVSVAQSVIFVNTKAKVDYLSQQLTAANHTVAAIHSGLSKEDRTHIMSEFRAGNSRVLITTDLIARGIDVHHVNIVINYDIPNSSNIQNYLHRIGRGGRYGRKGIAINFVSQRDVDNLKEIENYYHTAIEQLPDDFGAYLGE